MPVKPILFVSDLHLAPERPALVEAFKRFVRTEATQAAALYILGDLVEYWIGDEEANNAFNADLFAALRELSQSGVPVYFMHGNRDFLLGRRAARSAGAQLIADPTVVELFGTRTLLMHGDTLCTDDLAYQKARARWRRPLLIRGFLALPLVWRQRIGAKLRAKSEHSKQYASAAIMDVTNEAVEQAFRNYGYPRLIHGHTHRQARHEHRVDGYVCERWVLGDWYKRGSYLCCSPEGCSVVALD